MAHRSAIAHVFRPVRLTLLMALLMMAAASSCTPARADADADIRIDTARRYQTIDGFGTCLIGWSREYDALYATEAFQRIYATKVGCSMLRINLWGPVMPVPVEDWHDITYERFYLGGKGHRAATFLKFAKAVKKINPDIKLIGSVWTPPPWMKVNDSITGDRSDAIQGDRYEHDGRALTNRVKPELFHHFARWIVEMVKLHESEGVGFYAVSIGNEVMFTQPFDSCVWTPTDYATVVGILGDMLDAQGLGHVKIFGPETMTGHNWSTANPLYIRKIMANPAAARAFDIFATHGYTDGFQTDASSQSAAEFYHLIDQYGLPFWITEGGTGGHAWPQPLTGLAAMLHNALVAGHASAVVAWQISESQPNEHGLMVKGRMTPKTRVAQQYFRFVRPGAVRVGASPSDGTVKASAYVHERDHTLTIILTNPTDADQRLTLAVSPVPEGLEAMRGRRTSATESFDRLAPVAVDGGTLTLTLPAQSITTLQGAWAK